MLAYIFFLIVALFISSLSRRYKKISLILVVLFMSCAVGFRYNVGTDYEAYERIYNLIEQTFLEPSFTFLVNWLNSRHYSVTYLFFIMAFLTYSFFFCGLYKIKEALFPISLLLICYFSFDMVSNVSRQSLAASIFIFSYQFLVNRKIVPYMLCVLFATTFHMSAFLLIPLYFLLNRQMHPKLSIVLYILSFAFVFVDLATIAGPFQALLQNWQRYENYVESKGQDKMYLSLGVLLEMVNYAVMLYFALKVKFDKRHVVLYNILWLACITMNIRVGAPILIRIQLYFTVFVSVFLPLIIKEQKNYQTKMFLTIYFVTSYLLSTIVYYMTPGSKMLPYHDVFGIF